MRVLICGIDGYLGWSLAQHLAAHGHKIAGVDNGARRAWVAEVGSQSAIPIASRVERKAAFQKKFGVDLNWVEGDLCDYELVWAVLSSFQPEAIVHFAEMPSAPYSMIDVGHAVYTHKNNLISTLNLLFGMRDLCPNAHLLKLGTMGEYGTPNVDIPEGFFDIEYRGRSDRLPFPRQAGSWYHQTKVHDSNNIMMACRTWGLNSTDIMQGVVYGTRLDAMDDVHLRTRMDYDQCFGTAINRFCAQAVVGEPLTLYGTGSQQRGFLPLRDSIECFRLVLENPPEKGEYRVFNQFERHYTVADLAERVMEAAKEVGIHDVTVQRLENPRVEMEEHYYNPDREGLIGLGYKPTADMHAELVQMLEDLMRYADRIDRGVLVPDVRWDGSRRRSERLL